MIFITASISVFLSLNRILRIFTLKNPAASQGFWNSLVGDSSWNILHQYKMKQ